MSWIPIVSTVSFAASALSDGEAYWNQPKIPVHVFLDLSGPESGLTYEEACKAQDGGNWIRHTVIETVFVHPSEQDFGDTSLTWDELKFDAVEQYCKKNQISHVFAFNARKMEEPAVEIDVPLWMLVGGRKILDLSGEKKISEFDREYLSNTYELTSEEQLLAALGLLNVTVVAMNSAYQGTEAFSCPHHEMWESLDDPENEYEGFYEIYVGGDLRQGS